MKSVCLNPFLTTTKKLEEDELAQQYAREMKEGKVNIGRDDGLYYRIDCCAYECQHQSKNGQELYYSLAFALEVHKKEYKEPSLGLVQNLLIKLGKKAKKEKKVLSLRGVAKDFESVVERGNIDVKYSSGSMGNCGIYKDHPQAWRWPKILNETEEEVLVGVMKEDKVLIYKYHIEYGLQLLKIIDSSSLK